MKWFKKEVIASKLYCKATGAPFPFEQVGTDGVIATDNPVYSDELDIAAARGVGGVTAIDQATYDDLKKKSLGKASLKRLAQDRFSLSSLNLQLPSNVAVAAGGVSLHGQRPDTPAPVAEPIKVPLEFTRPRTGRFLKKDEGDVSK